MKVGIVLTQKYYPGKTFGGVERYVTELCHGLDKMNIEYELFYREGGSRWIGTYLFLRKVAKKLKKFNGVIHCQGWRAGIAALKSGRKFILTAHDLFPDDKVKKKICLRVFNEANEIISPSVEFAFEVAKKVGPLVRFPTIICNGIDTKKYINLNIERNIDFLILGRKEKLNSFKLDFLSKFNVYISDGSLSEEELIEKYNKAKYVIILTYGETFSYIALESILCGAWPIFITNNSDKLFIPAEIGWYSHIFSPSMFQEHVENLIYDYPGSLEVFSGIRQKFDIMTHITELLKVYKIMEACEH
ncbi:MAG: glycosyltransferase [Candidatus Odinarchaeia archaeon]